MGEATLTVVHTINHLLSPVISNQSPYERLFGSPPDYQLLCSFGSARFILFQSHDHTKLESRSHHCCSLGYGETQKGYQCYDHIAYHLRIYRHVVFWEHHLFIEISTFPSISQSFALELFSNEQSNHSSSMFVSNVPCILHTLFGHS